MRHQYPKQNTFWKLRRIQGGKYKRTGATRQAISQKNKGKHYSPNTQFSKGRIPHNRGIRGQYHKANPITPINSRIRQSVYYKEWRSRCFVRDNFTCQNCKRVGGDLEVHHIKSFRSFPLLRFDVNNGITLCKICHSKIDEHRKLKKQEEFYV